MKTISSKFTGLFLRKKALKQKNIPKIASPTKNIFVEAATPPIKMNDMVKIFIHFNAMDDDFLAEKK